MFEPFVIALGALGIPSFFILMGLVLFGRGFVTEKGIVLPRKKPKTPPDTRAQVRKHTNEMEQWLIDEGGMHDTFELTTWDESTPIPEITAPAVQPGFVSPQYTPRSMITTGGTVGSPYAWSNESYYHDQARCTCGVCSHARLRHEQEEAHARNVVAQMRNGLINSATAQQIAQMPMDAYAAQREFLLRQMREMAMIPSHTYARLPRGQEMRHIWPVLGEGND